MSTNTYIALDKVTLSATASSITFSSIPATYTDLVIVGYISGVSTATGVGARFNGDTGNNYSMTGLAGNGSAASSFRQTNVDYIRFSYEGTYRTTNQGIFRLNIMNYSNTTTYKTMLSRNDVSTDGTEAEVGLWRNTAAINQVTLVPTNGAYTFSVGSTFSLYGVAAAGVSPAAKATGGVIYSDSTYYYHVFGSTGTFTPLSSLTADILVVAGGGGGNDGGGGAGGLAYYASQSLSATGYTCTVGGGGAGSSSVDGTSGTNSSFTGLTAAVGGGGGRAYNAGNGTSGGSGGGAPRAASGTLTGGTATSGQGYAGGNSVSGSNVAGGGGGAGGAGVAGTGTYPSGTGGTGGAGSNTYATWLTATGLGTAGYLAGGGGGFSHPTQALGSNGGGNGSTNSLPATSGATNTGSGGGGAAGGESSTGNGGSGLVIVRYAK